MSIELHCPQCQKLIRAPDSAGGRRGKCPYCKNTVYIPTPPDETDEIPLAPIDEEAEQHEAELRRETTQMAVEVDRTTAQATDADDTGLSADGAGAEPGEGEPVDFDADVEAYVLAMGESKLDEAEAAAARLSEAGTHARDYVQGLMLDDKAPQFENVPPPVVNGFLKKLLTRLG